MSILSVSAKPTHRFVEKHIFSFLKLSKPEFLSIDNICRCIRSSGSTMVTPWREALLARSTMCMIRLIKKHYHPHHHLDLQSSPFVSSSCPDQFKICAKDFLQFKVFLFPCATTPKVTKATRIQKLFQVISGHSLVLQGVGRKQVRKCLTINLLSGFTMIMIIILTF